MKIDVTSVLKDSLTMVLAFWFMRQRTSASGNPTAIHQTTVSETIPPPNPTQPATPAQPKVSP
jgi:hypothetical protein